ncbi:type II toxin-antitoxin system HicB family antitoxin [Magnetospirillum moscoviense]|uniref:HicB-like antitoxin of toxin-antitoxin system domain-containing protein n=1 Tax=Magnetospirillum moscoviense TaxID=1437059 RepID=A0A178MRP1_9PROT|nr:type II toxin-antitoxin system HicB family antitoxin [Magnetospirillum moscoviense]MBF0324003.1 type II toxin-antitoxin system HicB family antitoxin [Alphaproteobacteria bacterium]OAN50778.1 hypothetical protein A6A05_11700 [Magnetospirillum moscoviense]
MERSYFAVVEASASGDIGVWFPDFSGCVTAGGSYSEALLNAREALQFHVDGMVEDGEAIPEPTPFENLPADRGHLAVALVSVSLQSRSKRINITMDEALLALIEARTNNVSGFLAEAARDRLASLR